MYVNKILLLTLFSVAVSQELNEKDINEKYDYKNYVVTFENYGSKDEQSIATWKVEDDTTSTKGHWFSHLAKLKAEGWEVSRAMPGKWKGTEEVTMVYYLEKLQKEKQ